MKILCGILLISFVRNFHLSDLVEARKEMNKVVQEMKKKQQIPQERKLLQIEGVDNQKHKNEQQKRKFFIHQDRYLKPVSTGAFERKLEQEKKIKSLNQNLSGRILSEKKKKQNKKLSKKKVNKKMKKKNKKLSKKKVIKKNKKLSKKKVGKKLKKASKEVQQKIQQTKQTVVQQQTQTVQKQTRKLQDRKLSKAKKHKNKHHKKALKKHKKKHHKLRFRLLSSSKGNSQVRKAEKIEIDERNLRQIPSLNEYYNEQLNLYGRIQFNI